MHWSTLQPFLPTADNCTSQSSYKDKAPPLLEPFYYIPTFILSTPGTPAD